MKKCGRWHAGPLQEVILEGGGYFVICGECQCSLNQDMVLRYRSMAGVANAVAAGIGLAPLPSLYFEDPAFKDVLIPVLTEYPLREATLYVVYVSRKYVPLKIRTFIDFLSEALADRPNQLG